MLRVIELMTMLILAVAAGAAAGAGESRRVALIIGNDAYRAR